MIIRKILGPEQERAESNTRVLDPLAGWQAVSVSKIRSPPSTETRESMTMHLKEIKSKGKRLAIRSHCTANRVKVKLSQRN